MKTLLINALFTIHIFTASCVVEDVAYGDYYITNDTMNMLVISAFDKSTVTMKIELLQNEINPGVKAHVFTAIENTGGHIMPSNFWSKFYVYNEIISDSTIIYSGIDDSDWQIEGRNADGYNILNLVVN
jgi:hypothetical protein